MTDGTSALAVDDSAVSIGDALTAANLRALAGGEISLIWHKGYYAADACEAALPAIRAACEASSYTLTPDLQSLGTSIGEASENEVNERRYFDTAYANAHLIRDDIFGFQRSPIDAIRLDVDELWPGGASVARSKSGDLMLSGIVRRWTRGGKANPHIDQSDIPLLRHLSLNRRIGINVYVAVPPLEGGGEIEFWGRVTDERSYEANKRSDYGLDRAMLGDQVARIHPGQGDLVAFDAARIHAVAEITGGERVTVACFLGVPAESDKPIRIFA